MNKKVLFLVLSAVLIAPVAALAQANYDCGPTITSPANSLHDFACNVQISVLNVGIPIVIIGWVITGILWLTSGGAPDKLGTAKKAAMACVVGTANCVSCRWCDDC